VKILIDASYLTFKWALRSQRWDWFEEMLQADVLFAFDDDRNLRVETYPFYKSNRGELLDQRTKDLKAVAKQWQEQIKFFHPERCVQWEGAEADDVLAELSRQYPNAYLMSEDHDMLQLTGVQLVNQHMEPWDVDRLKKYTKLPLKRGRTFLAYQLLYGCRTDCVPRRLFSKDRYTGPWVMSQPDPLATAIELLPRKLVIESLNCLMLPSPLLTGADPIEAALALPA